MRAPHAAFAARRGIFIRRRIPKGRSCSSRCRFPTPDATVFRRGSFGCDVVWRSAQSVFPERPMQGASERPPALAAHSPRPSAEGAQPDLATSDTLCRAAGATAGSPNPTFAPSPVFRQEAVTHAARTPDDDARLKAKPLVSPGCLPSARYSTSRTSEAIRDPFDVHAKVLAPLSHGAVRRSSSRELPPFRATPRPLGSPRGSPRRPGQDASYRPLQPTYDTSTRRSLGFRTRNSRCGRPLDPSPTEIGFFRAAPNHHLAAAIQLRLGTRLTARLQLQPSRTRRSLGLSTIGNASTTKVGDATLARRCRPSAELADDL